MSTQVNLRVTLVQAPKWTIYTPSYALALLAGNLRSHGFPVAVLDLDIDLYSAVREEHKGRWLDSSGSFWDSDENVAALAVEYSAVFDGFVSRILATAPDVVGFSTKIRSRCMTLLLAEKIKAARPGVYVILGGPEITGGVARFLEPCPFIDAVCTQEADLSFPAFLKSYHAHGRQPQPEPGFAYRDASGKIVDCGPIAGPPGWEQIPFADYSDFDFGRYQNPSAITMMLSRGCINRCSFCSESVSFLRYRARPAENIHEEIKFYARTSNARRPLRIYFNDSLVNGDLEQLECLADLLIADPVEGGVQFSGMMLIREKMTDELLRKLARAGMVETLFGVETGSPDMIRRMRKNFDLDDAERIIRVASESGIMTAVSIIFGHPGETESDYFQTIAFMKRIAPHVDTFLLNTLGLFGESAISRDLAGYGIDPGTADVMQWTGDGGANTYEVRRNRFLNALTLFRDKAADIGGFGDGAIEGDPLRLLRERIKAIPARVADAVRIAAGFEAAMPPEQPAPGPVGFLDSIERLEDGGLRLVGWAIEPCRGIPARHVVLTGDDGRVLGYATAELRRADVALATGNPSAKFAGWEAVISPASAAGRAPESLSAFVYDPEGGCRYRLTSAVGQGEPPVQARPATPSRIAAQTRYGVLHIPPKDDPIGVSLLNFGEWAQSEIEVLARFVPEGGVVVDGGANVGTHTLAFARMVGPSGHVHAYEPQAALADMLRRSLADNGIAQATVHEAGLGSGPGRMLIAPPDTVEHANFGAVSLGALTGSSPCDSGGTVEVRSLDGEELARCDLVKLDIEGMEPAALSGMSGLIARCRPVILAECNSVDAAFAITRVGVWDGYCMALLRTPAFREDNHHGNGENCFGTASETNLLFLCKDKHSMPGELPPGVRLDVFSTSEELALAISRPPGSPAVSGRAEDEEKRRARYRRVLAAMTAPPPAPSPAWHLRIREFGKAVLHSPRGAALPPGIHKPCPPPGLQLEIPQPPQQEPADLIAKGVVLICTSGLFDADFYVGQGAACGNCDPLAHYLEIGWKLGLDPGPAFSTTGYLGAHPDVCAAGINPLLHYMLHGRQERRECPDPRRVLKSNPVRTPVEPAGPDWDALRTRPASGEPVVDVVVPVFQGRAETLRCLFSVLSSKPALPFQLIVIDDCSPDAGLSAEMKRLAQAGHFSLHTNPENEGFVRSCNRAMALHPDRDVVLLNSDTEVFGDWLARLRAAATRRDAVGTVTPFTNSNGICSYPRFSANNPEALEMEDAELDKLAAEVNRGLDAEMPTGVGFCLYIRRACLNDVGLFDADSFPRGYGEESDFCRRAAMRGWRNILAADVFVRHFGGVSFRDERISLTREAGKMIERLHPGYHDVVEEFNREDPLRPLRMRLDVARLERAASPIGAVLLVAHARGGGTEKHVQELGSLLREEGRAVVFCRPDPDAAGRITLAVQGIEAPNLPGFSMGSDAGRFGDFLRKAGIVHVHIHGLVDFGTVASGFFREACSLAGLAYDVTVHDYQSLCPRLHLVDKEGRYCGEPELDVCEVCADDPKLLAGAGSVKEWRREHAALLSGARRVFVPEADVARRLRCHLPQIPVVVRPHPETHAPQTVRSILRPRAGVARRILVLGAIGREKGSELFVRTARCARAMGLGLEFVLLGYTDRDEDLSSIGNVFVLGKYDDAGLPERLRAIDADLVWFPAICPETWSYTLSRVLDAGLFPVAFDLGSIASRIRASGWGKILPMERMLDPQALVRDLAAVAVPDRVPLIAVQGGRYPSPVTETYYGGLGPTERKKLK